MKHWEKTLLYRESLLEAAIDGAGHRGRRPAVSNDPSHSCCLDEPPESEDEGSVLRSGTRAWKGTQLVQHLHVTSEP